MFSTPAAVLEQFNLGNAPFVLVFWEKNCFPGKSTLISISNVNYFKIVRSRTVNFVRSKGN